MTLAAENRACRGRPALACFTPCTKAEHTPRSTATMVIRVFSRSKPASRARGSGRLLLSDRLPLLLENTLDGGNLFPDLVLYLRKGDLQVANALQAGAK